MIFGLLPSFALQQAWQYRKLVTDWLVILALLGAGALAGGDWIESRRQRPSVGRRLGERIDAYYGRQRGIVKRSMSEFRPDRDRTRDQSE